MMQEGRDNQIQLGEPRKRRNTSSGSSTNITIQAQQHTSHSNSNHFDAQEIIQLILRYKTTITLFAIFGGLLGWFYASSRVPHFKSISTISIKAPSIASDEKKNSESGNKLLIYSTLESLSLADTVLSDEKYGKEFVDYLKFGLPGEHTEKSFFEKVVDFFKSLFPQDDLLTAKDIEIAKKTGTYDHPVNLLKKYQENFKYEFKESANLLEIAASSRDHILSSNLANVHGQQFITYLREKQTEKLEENTKFLRERVDEAASRLAIAENALLEFAKENNFVLNSEEQTNNKYIELSSQLNQVLLERAELEGLLAEARATRGKSALGDASSEINEMSFSLRQKQREYSNLLDSTSLNRKSPRLIELRKEIRQTRDLIRNRRDESISVLEARYRAARNKEEILRKEIEIAKDEGFTQSKSQIEYNILQTKVGSLKSLHSQLTAELDTAYANEENNQINAILAAAATPASPYFERYTGFLIILGFVCGIISGVGVAYAQNMLDDTIQTSEDLEKILGIKSLGMLPKIERNSDDPLAGSYENLDVINPDDLEKSHISDKCNKTISLENRDLVMVKRPRSAESEAIRSIRTSIMLSNMDSTPKVILVTSGKQGEGKTTLSSNLAISFAQDGNKTIVIDADLRRPGLSTLFSVFEETPGLSHCLSGRKSLDEVIQPTAITDFYVIPAGSIPVNPAELLNSAKMIALLETLRSQFDTIIIDAPPVLPVTDSLILSKMADGIVLVVRAGKTVKEIPKQSIKRLDQVSANILGLVANGVDTKKNYYYSGYYRDVYSYYGKPKKKSSLFSLGKKK